MDSKNIYYGKNINTGAIEQIKSVGNVLLTSAGTLNNLSDVVITTPTANQILKYSSPNWINGTIATSNLSDVSYGTLASGDLLTYNGSNWSNAQPALKDYITINMYGSTTNSVYQTNTLKQIMAGTSIFWTATTNPVTNTQGNMTARRSPLSSVLDIATGFISLTSTKTYLLTATINQSLNVNSGTQTELAIYNSSSGSAVAFSPNFNIFGRIDTDFQNPSLTVSCVVSGISSICVMYRFVTAQSVSANAVDTNITFTALEI
jgi:hypothetical protein